MKTIYKYLVPQQTKFELEIPRGSKFLTLQKQNNSQAIWFEVDTEEKKMRIKFEIYGTGWNLNSSMDKQYLGTFVDGAYVWHLYAKEYKFNAERYD